MQWHQHAHLLARCGFFEQWPALLNGHCTDLFQLMSGATDSYICVQARSSSGYIFRAAVYVRVFKDFSLKRHPSNHFSATSKYNYDYWSCAGWQRHCSLTERQCAGQEKLRICLLLINKISSVPLNTEGVESPRHGKHTLVYLGHNYIHGLVLQWGPRHRDGTKSFLSGLSATHLFLKQQPILSVSTEADSVSRVATNTS